MDSDDLLLKEIYHLYYDKGERLLDIFDHVMYSRGVDVDDLTKLIKTNPKLMDVYRNECEVMRLLKGKLERIDPDRMF